MPDSPSCHPRTQTLTPAFVERGGELTDLRLAVASEGRGARRSSLKAFIQSLQEVSA